MYAHEEAVYCSGVRIASVVLRCETPWSRACGLIRRELAPGECALLSPAAQVHTFGMTFPIDVVFCDRAFTIVRIVRSLRPRRVTRWARGARYALEMRAGSIPPWLGSGQRLRIGDA